MHIKFRYENVKTLVSRPRGRYEGNTKTDLIRRGWEYAHSINLIQDTDQQQAVANMVMNLQVP
jgi:hypothetical protein